MPEEITRIVNLGAFQSDPLMLSLNEFLETYKKPGLIASTTDLKTQAYVLWTEDEETGEDRFYTHPPCDKAPVEDYMAFMIEFRRLFKREPCTCDLEEKT